MSIIKEIISGNFIKCLSFSVILSAFTFFSFGQKQTAYRDVDVVLCMDLSGSTNGLLDNFRDKMWDIINQWQMYSPRPVVRIGLIGFSRYSFTDGSGYVRVFSDLTDDYDALSKQMFAVQPYVENGIQFVGAAIGTATTQLTWSKKPDAVKIMYVLGNGVVNLGSFDYRARCEEAAKEGIIIHPVYCIKNDKQLRQKEIPGWNEIATLTGGEFSQVYVNKRAPLVTSPVNLMALASINDSINKTFLPYGKNGIDHLKLMLSADNNAVKTYEAYFYSRLKYKMSEHYSARMLTWDVTSYKNAYPESKLAAVRSSVKADNTGVVDLEALAKNYSDTRNRLYQSLKSNFPEGEEDRIHKEVSAEEYELENRLDKTLIRTYHNTLVKEGFKD